jgi:hypothetical protein
MICRARRQVSELVVFALNPASFRSTEEALRGASWERKSALAYKDTQPVKHSRSFIRGNNVATLSTD